MCRTDGCGKYALYGVEDTNLRHLWLVNKGERTSTSPLALGYPLLGPPRRVRAYRCMPQSSLGFRCSDQFCHKMFRPLIHRPASFPLVLGYSRPLVGVNADSSEIVQETPHLLFFLAPHTARGPHQFSKHHALQLSRIHVQILDMNLKLTKLHTMFECSTDSSSKLN